MRFRVILFLLILFIGHTFAHADIYKWKDADGKWHFGDTPSSGKDCEVVESSAPDNKSIIIDKREKDQSGGLIKNITISRATLLVEIKDGYTRMTLRPEVVNNNSEDVDLKIEISFYNTYNTEVYKGLIYYQVNSLTRSVNPKYFHSFNAGDTDAFDIYSVKSITLRYSANDDREQIKKNNDVTIEILPSSSPRSSKEPAPQIQKDAPKYVITQISIESLFGGDIRVSGRLSGPYCPELTMNIKITNDYGDFEYLTAIVKDAGSNASSLFDTSKRMGWSAQLKWKLSDVSFECTKKS